MTSLALFLAILTGSVRGAEPLAGCADCHAVQAEEFSASIHSALECRDCHGGSATYEIAPQALQRYTEAPPGGRTEFDHGGDFTGKPARPGIPQLCGDCHADVVRMNPYGPRTDQLARYKTSGHGRTLVAKNDERVAVCVDCHGAHAVLPATDPNSLTYPANVPDTCGKCHADAALMGEYDLPVEIVTEYRGSVHGRLLLEQGDTGAPTCATCHGNHSAVPPGFGSVGAVCGRCHHHASDMFARSVHAEEEGFRGCVQCHGGGSGSHFHNIARITKPSGVLIQRYAHLLQEVPDPSHQAVAASINPDPRKMMEANLEGCMDCHEDVSEDESLAGMFRLLDRIESTEREYVETGRRLEEIAQGVLLVDRQRFTFEDARTHLIELAPVQHALTNEIVAEKAREMSALCAQVNEELDELVGRLEWRRKLLLPIWGFALVFSLVLYAKFKSLKRRWVKRPGAGPKPDRDSTDAPTRRGFLDWAIGVGSAVVGLALAVPALAYLWPAAKGGAAERVEVDGASDLQPGQSKMVQLVGKAVIVVRHRDGFRAFSAACTHLGCLVKWDPAARDFKCPCHAAVFDMNGTVVSGPPPSPLVEYSVKEIGDKVFVSPA